MIKHQFPFSTSCGIKCLKLERRLVISPIHFISTCHWCAKLFEAAVYMAIPLTGLLLQRWWHRCVSHPRQNDIVHPKIHAGHEESIAWKLRPVTNSAMSIRVFPQFSSHKTSGWPGWTKKHKDFDTLLWDDWSVGVFQRFCLWESKPPQVTLMVILCHPMIFCLHW